MVARRAERAEEANTKHERVSADLRSVRDGRAGVVEADAALRLAIAQIEGRRGQGSAG